MADANWWEPTAPGPSNALPANWWEPSPTAAPDNMVRVPIVAGRAGVTGYRMVPQSQLDAGTTGALEDAGRVAGNGATLGLLDNAIAGGEAALGSGNYQDNLATQHADTAQAMQRPGASFLYNSAAMAPGAFGAGTAATGAKMMGDNLGARLFANSVAGTALAGTDAFDSADGTVGQRFQQALMPAATGAILGGSIPAAAEGAGNLVSSGAKKVMNALYSSRYGSTLPADVADPLLAGLGNQGQTVAQARQAMTALGPGAVLADTGEGLQGQANRLANNDIATRPGITTNLQGRMADLDTRLGTAVDQNFGPDLNAVTQLNNLKATTQANGKQLYGAARANPAPIDTAPVLQELDNQINMGLQNDPITSALKTARSYIAGNGNPVTIDNLHRAQDLIDDMGNSAYRAGNNAQARALWQTRTDLLKQMDTANPQYGVARQQFATDKAIENAFQNGRDVLATRADGQVFDPDLLESRLAQMSQPEQQAYSLGARKAITDVMGQARSDPAGLRTKLANDDGYAVGKLRQVFGDQPVQNMLGELQNQATMRGTNNAVLGNSATAFRSAADDTIPGFGKESSAPAAATHGGVALASMAGAEAGHQLGSIIGHPELGAGVGAVAGPAMSWAAGKLAASNAVQSAAEQGVARQGMASALTTAGQQAVMDALGAREQMAPMPASLAGGAKKILNALLMQQAAEGRNSQAFTLMPKSLALPSLVRQ